MGTEEGTAHRSFPAHHNFGTWNPALRLETGISSDDDDSTASTAERVHVFTGYANNQSSFGPRPRQDNGRGYGRSFNRAGGSYNRQRQQGREAYWCSTGPKMETRKLLGYTIDLPLAAPMSAPAEDKKLILSQTRDKIAEAGTSDWPAKSQLLAQRFVVAVPNATNEAKVRLAKLRDWTSDVFTYGPPTWTDLAQTPVDPTVAPHLIRYMSMEMRIHPRRAPSQEFSVPDLPTERSLAVLLKVPLNDVQNDVHPDVTVEMLTDAGNLLAHMKSNNKDIVFGRRSMAGTCDINAFDKDFRMVFGECMFHTVYALLLRDYVGKGITKDIQKRLRDCRQIIWTDGRMRIKSVAEQHADFMRLVQEFDVDEQIPANLPNIAFHNASWDIQQELANMKYEPPADVSSTAEQFTKLAEFQEKATEAEKRLNQLESVVRRIGGPRNSGTTSSFLTTIAPQDQAYLNEVLATSGNMASDPQDRLEFEPTSELQQENKHLFTMLSVAERALRRSSGEVAPLECWGCKDIPEFEKDKFHRFRACPRRHDPRVRANFEKNLRMWTTRKRQNDGAYGPRTQNPLTPQQGDQRWKAARNEVPGQKTMLGKVEGDTANEIGRFVQTGETGTANGTYQQAPQDAGDAPNLLAEFGILQEGSRANNGSNNVRFTCNMATLIQKDPTLAGELAKGRMRRNTTIGNKGCPPGKKPVGSDWAVCWEEETGRETRAGPPRKDSPNCPYEPQTTIWAAQTLCRLNRDTEVQRDEKNPLNMASETLCTGEPPIPRKEPLIRIGNPYGLYLRKPVRMANGAQRGQGLGPACGRRISGSRSQDLKGRYDGPLDTKMKPKIGAHNSTIGTKVPGIQQKRSPRMWSQTSLMAVPHTGNNPGVRPLTPTPFLTSADAEMEEIMDAIQEIELGGMQEEAEPWPWEDELEMWETLTQDATKGQMLPFLPYPVVGTSQEEGRGCKYMAAIMRNCTAIRDIVVRGSTLQQGEAASPPIVTFLQESSDSTEHIKAILRTKAATEPRVAPFREHVWAGTLDLRFQTPQDCEHFIDTLVAEEMLTPQDTMEKWCHVDQVLIKLPENEQTRGETITPADWRVRLDEIAAALLQERLREAKIPVFSAPNPAVAPRLEQATADQVESRQVDTSSGRNSATDYPLPNTGCFMAAVGGNVGQNSGTERFEDTTTAPAVEITPSGAPKLHRSAIDPVQNHQETRRQDHSGNFARDHMIGPVLRPYGASQSASCVWRGMGIQMWNSGDNCRAQWEAATTKETEDRRKDGEGDDWSLAVSIAKSDPRGARHQVLLSDLSAARCINDWFFAKQLVTLRVRSLAQKMNGKVHEAARMHEHFHLTPGLAIGEDYIGIHPLPIPTDIDPGLWITYRRRGVISNADWSMACQMNTDPTGLKWATIEQARDIRDWKRAVADRASKEQAMIASGWNTSAVRSLMRFHEDRNRNRYRAERYPGRCFFIPFQPVTSRGVMERAAGTNGGGAAATASATTLDPAALLRSMPPLNGTREERRRLFQRRDIPGQVQWVNYTLTAAAATPQGATNLGADREDGNLPSSGESAEGGRQQPEGILSVARSPLPMSAPGAIHEAAPSVPTRQRGEPAFSEVQWARGGLGITDRENRLRTMVTRVTVDDDDQYTPPRSRLQHLSELNHSSVEWPSDPGPMPIVRATLRTASGNTGYPVYLAVDTGSNFNLLDRTRLEQICTNDEFYEGLQQQIAHHRGNIAEALRLGTGLRQTMDTALGFKMDFPDAVGQHTRADPDNTFPIAFGIANDLGGLPAHGIIGTHFLHKYKGILRFQEWSPGHLTLQLTPYEGRNLVVGCRPEPSWVQLRSPRTERTARRLEMSRPSGGPDEQARKRTRRQPRVATATDWQVAHPITRLGVGDVQGTVVTLVPDARIRRHQQVGPTQTVRRIGGHPLAGLAEAYVATDLLLTPDQADNCIIQFQPHAAFCNRGILRGSNPHIVGGVVARSNHGIHRVFLKIDLSRSAIPVSTEHATALGTARLWAPESQGPRRSDMNEMTQVDAECEIRGALRRAADASRHTAREESVTEWRVYDTGKLVMTAPSRTNTEEGSGSTSEENVAVPENRFEDSQDLDTPALPTQGNLSDESTLTTPDDVEDDQGTQSRPTSEQPQADAARTTIDDPSASRPPATATYHFHSPTTHTHHHYHTTRVESGTRGSTTRHTIPLRTTTATRHSDPSGEASASTSGGYCEINTSQVTVRINEGAPQTKERPPQASAFLSMIRVFQTRRTERPIEVATTARLPHIVFPVGTRQSGQSWESVPKIRALLDTGSGLNIGYLPYWESVATKHPELVKEFQEMEASEQEKLTIGGIDRHGNGTLCTHYIVLRTPFVDAGLPVELRIALTDGLSCNLIFGLPFIVKAKLTINMWEKYAVSTVFNYTFPLHYHPPELRESVLPQSGQMLALTAHQT